MKKVSIITATYNKFDNFDKTIRSVLSQDYSNIEYIITDDGSDSFPVDLIENLKESCSSSRLEWKIIRNENNIGTVKNLNNAIKESTGEYILFLSCGDVYFSRTVVSRIVTRFMETDALLISTTRIMYDDNYNPVSFIPHLEEQSIINQFDSPRKQYIALVTNEFYDMASGSSTAYSKKAFRKYGLFNENYLLWEDGPFYTMICRHETITFAFDIISMWYEAGGVSSQSNNISPKMRIDILYYNSTERTKYIKELNIRDRRRIKYKILCFKYENSFIKRIIDLIMLPEACHYHLIQKQRQQRLIKERATLKDYRNDCLRLRNE